MISCCVARKHLCSQCDGTSIKHDDHDKIFGGKRVYFVCLGIWILAFAALLPNIVGTSGTFGWTGYVLGCDWMSSGGESSSIGGFILVIGNIFFMIAFYSTVVINLFMKRRKIICPEDAAVNQLIKSICLTLLLLVVVYAAHLVPMSFGPTFRSYEVDSILISIYWWMYGVNFIIYLTITTRIREAYRKFIKDMWKKIWTAKAENQEESESSDF